MSATKNTGPQYDPKKRYTIEIASDSSDGGDQPVKVAVNGNVAVIKRGVKVDVLGLHLNALMDARATRYKPVKNPKEGESRYITEDYQRYSLSVYGEAKPAAK